jgi:hypothetical protein
MRTNVPPSERIWATVEKTESCWIRRTRKTSDAYTSLKVDGKLVLAHRLAWQLASGTPPPNDLLVCHVCDTPACLRNDEQGVYAVNGVEYPRWGHLWLAPIAANNADRDNKGRSKIGKGRDKHTYQRGVDHPRGKAILKLADVRRVRDLYEDGVPIGVLARAYRCHYMIIWNIVRWKTWQLP